MPRWECRPIIRMAYYGCTNRPFFHIVATDPRAPREGPIFEQLGTYDPLPNKNGEKLVGLNLNRIQHWLCEGAYTSRNVKALLGLGGFLPIYPDTLVHARRKQMAAEVRERVAAGETVEGDDVPLVNRFRKYHVLYDFVTMPDEFVGGRIDYASYEKDYRNFSKYSEENMLPPLEEES